MSDSWKLWFIGMGIGLAVSIPYAISQVIANKRQENVNAKYVEQNKGK